MKLTRNKKLCILFLTLYVPFLIKTNHKDLVISNNTRETIDFFLISKEEGSTKLHLQAETYITLRIKDHVYYISAQNNYFVLKKNGTWYSFCDSESPKKNPRLILRNLSKYLTPI